MYAALVRAWLLSGLLLLTACQAGVTEQPPAKSPLVEPIQASTTSTPAPNAPPASSPSTTTTSPSPASLPAQTPADSPSTLPPATESPAAAISPLNAAALTSTLEIRFSPWQLVHALAWSPDGSSLAVSAGDQIGLYRSPSFHETSLIPAGVWSTALAFHPDGSLLASAGRDGSISVWRTLTGELLHSRVAHKKGAYAVAFSPDGRLLASGGSDAIARLWDAATGEPLGQMIGGTHAVPALAFQPGEASLAIVNGNLIRWRDTASQRILRTLRAQASIYTLAFNPAGDRLATGDSSGQVQIWDISKGEPLFSLPHSSETVGPAALVWKVIFSPDGALLASAGGDGTVQLWRVSDGARLASLSAHSPATSSLAFSPDGRWLASGGLDGVVRLWQARP